MVDGVSEDVGRTTRRSARRRARPGKRSAVGPSESVERRYAKVREVERNAEVAVQSGDEPAPPARELLAQLDPRAAEEPQAENG